MMDVRDATLLVLEQEEASLRNETYHAAQVMDCKKATALNERWHKVFRLKCGLVERSMTLEYVHAVMQATMSGLLNNIKKLAEINPTNRKEA